MEFQLPALSQETSTALFYGAIGIIVALIPLSKLGRGPNLRPFPTVGSSNWLGSWWASLKFLTNAASIMQEGYEKHGSAPFKIAELSHWTVILTDHDHLEEVAKAREDELSVMEAMKDLIQMHHMVGPMFDQGPKHTALIRGQLTRNIKIMFSSIRDEIITSFDDILELKGCEWKSVTAMDLIQQVICRASNRIFVGLPLCRDPDWIDLNIRYASDIVIGGIIVGFFPEFMRPLATRLLTNIPRSVTRGMNLLRPIVEERLKFLDEYGSEWDDKPNDVLSWLIDEVVGPELSIENLTVRVLMVNFTAIHGTSNFFTQTVFYLAAHPQYVPALRQEIEDVVAKDGWSKVAISKMRKVDSFMRECMRLGTAIAGLSRKAVKDYKFHDGTFIPKGTLIYAASLNRPLLHSKNPDENAQLFEPFRFVDMQEEDAKGVKYQFTSTSPEYLGFGHRRHACPGRFFAAVELKTMLAHMILNYDMKLDSPTTGVPPNLYVGTLPWADPHAKVMFRRKQNK